MVSKERNAIPGPSRNSMPDPSHRQSAREGSSAADMQSNNNDTRSAVNGTQETPRAKGKRKANTPETPTPRKRPKLEKSLSCRAPTNDEDDIIELTSSKDEEPPPSRSQSNVRYRVEEGDVLVLLDTDEEEDSSTSQAASGASPSTGITPIGQPVASGSLTQEFALWETLEDDDDPEMLEALQASFEQSRPISAGDGSTTCRPEEDPSKNCGGSDMEGAEPSVDLPRHPSSLEDTEPASRGPTPLRPDTRIRSPTTPRTPQSQSTENNASSIRAGPSHSVPPPCEQPWLRNPLLEGIGLSLRVRNHQGKVPTAIKEEVVHLRMLNGSLKPTMTKYRYLIDLSASHFEVFTRHPDPARNCGLLVVISGPHTGRFVRRIGCEWSASGSWDLVVVGVDRADPGAETIGEDVMYLNPKMTTFAFEEKATRASNKARIEERKADLMAKIKNSDNSSSASPHGDPERGRNIATGSAHMQGPPTATLPSSQVADVPVQQEPIALASLPPDDADGQDDLQLHAPEGFWDMGEDRGLATATQASLDDLANVDAPSSFVPGLSTEESSTSSSEDRDTNALPVGQTTADKTSPTETYSPVMGTTRPADGDFTQNHQSSVQNPEAPSLEGLTPATPPVHIKDTIPAGLSRDQSIQADTAVENSGVETMASPASSSDAVPNATPFEDDWATHGQEDADDSDGMQTMLLMSLLQQEEEDMRLAIEDSSKNAQVQHGADAPHPSSSVQLTASRTPSPTPVPSSISAEPSQTMQPSSSAVYTSSDFPSCGYGVDARSSTHVQDTQSSLSEGTDRMSITPALPDLPSGDVEMKDNQSGQVWGPDDTIAFALQESWNSYIEEPELVTQNPSSSSSAPISPVVSPVVRSVTGRQNTVSRTSHSIDWERENRMLLEEDDGQMSLGIAVSSAPSIENRATATTTTLPDIAQPAGGRVIQTESAKPPPMGLSRQISQHTIDELLSSLPSSPMVTARADYPIYDEADHATQQSFFTPKLFARAMRFVMNGRRDTVDTLPSALNPDSAMASGELSDSSGQNTRSSAEPAAQPNDITDDEGMAGAMASSNSLRKIFEKSGVDWSAMVPRTDLATPERRISSTSQHTGGDRPPTSLRVIIDDRPSTPPYLLANSSALEGQGSPRLGSADISSPDSLHAIRRSPVNEIPSFLDSPPGSSGPSYSESTPGFQRSLTADPSSPDFSEISTPSSAHMYHAEASTVLRDSPTATMGDHGSIHTLGSTSGSFKSFFDGLEDFLTIKPTPENSRDNGEEDMGEYTLAYPD